MTESESMDLISLGRLLGAHGVRGEMKVHTLTEIRSQLLDLSTWLLGPEGGPYREVVLESGRENAKGLIVRLQGVDDRDGAQALSWDPYLGAPFPASRTGRGSVLLGRFSWLDGGDRRRGRSWERLSIFLRPVPMMSCQWTVRVKSG